jgi:hypothetical protein
MIVPEVIEKALQRRYSTQLPAELQAEGSIAKLVREEIQRWCDDEKDELPVSVREYNQRWIRGNYEGDQLKEGEKVVAAFIRTAWIEPIAQKHIPWKLLDGKAILKRVRRKLQEYGLVLSDDAILNTMTLDDFDDSIKETTSLVHSWF